MSEAPEVGSTWAQVPLAPRITRAFLVMPGFGKDEAPVDRQYSVGHFAGEWSILLRRSLKMTGDIDPPRRHPAHLVTVRGIAYMMPDYAVAGEHRCRCNQPTTPRHIRQNRDAERPHSRNDFRNPRNYR